ncbi:nitroreductase [Actinoplanes sp. CA-252034]|uniref:nitroreductase n=1 Tax=Actinoplanes sp. CA-252034 TaxID=3239906 RepID=UPI003D99DFF4
MTSVRPAGRRIANEIFYQAIAAAQQAPSAHDAQPWRWKVTNGVLDLFLHIEPPPGLPAPDGRLATIGCGAALHHARLTLAAGGWRVTTTRLPDPTEPAHLARLHLDGPAPVSPGTTGLARIIELRRTDRRPVTGRPITPEQLSTIRAAFESQHVRLAVLRPDQILGLAVATSHTGSLEPADRQWQSELALWAGGDRIVGAPHHLSLPVTRDGHDRAATFVVLHGPGDQSRDWLHAGEALSAGSLVAAELGVSTLPFSAPIEHERARAILRDAVPDLGCLYLMARLGHHSTEADQRTDPADDNRTRDHPADDPMCPAWTDRPGPA